MRFAVGLGASLLLHAALVLPWLTRERPHQRPPQREQLVVDLLGMLSNRQVEQQVAQPEQVPVEVPVKVPARPLPKSVAKKEARELEPSPRQSAPSPVQVARAVDEPVRASPVPAVPPEPPVQVAAAPPTANTAPEDRTQQTVRTQTTDANALRKYLATLKKAIQARLVYPAEAREAGHVGAPVIRFSLAETGEIVSGSLVVQKSSGYPMLDECAMRAALAGAPFEKPPRQMEIAIAVVFAAEASR